MNVYGMNGQINKIKFIRWANDHSMVWHRLTFMFEINFSSCFRN